MSEVLADADAMYFLDKPEHPGIAALTAYWESKRNGNAMPDRRDIVPSEIVKLLPNLHICEVLEDGRDFRFRLFGTALVTVLGAEMTGKRVSEIGGGSIVSKPDAARRRWLDVTSRAYEGRHPVFASGHLVNTIRRNVRWHSFAAPLTAGGAATEQILGAIFFIEE
ncbi:MAG TPA: PAS domain-containing protein [Parvibaculum sp.]